MFAIYIFYTSVFICYRLININGHLPVLIIGRIHAILQYMCIFRILQHTNSSRCDRVLAVVRY